MSNRTSFARCSNFLLSPFSKTFRVTNVQTFIADLASPGGLGISGSGWSRQGRTTGTSESFLCPFGTSDPGVGRHVQATQDVSSLYPRTVPDSSDCRLEGQVDPSTNWSGVRVYVVCKLFKTVSPMGTTEVDGRRSRDLRSDGVHGLLKTTGMATTPQFQLQRTSRRWVRRKK